MSVKVVTFDCWGTLFLDSPAADEVYRAQRLAGIEAALTASGVSVRPRDLERAYGASARYLARIWQDHRDVSVELHVHALLDALDPAWSSRVGRAALDEMIEAYSRPALTVAPAVDRSARDTLEALAARGCALAVISNIMRTPGRVLKIVLDRARLLECFSVLTFSDECGIRKPDPEIFWRTLREVGVTADHAVHVGDDAVLDVEGARDAGMRVIQLSASGRATGAVKPDAVVSRLADVALVFERLGW